MEEENIQKKYSKLKLFIIFFIVSNIIFYFNVRSKWMYEGQPYSQAKEWRIPSDMMMVYCSWLVKLPFVDERSLILKPFFSLKDYFTHKWEENLPIDDAERYMDDYFKYRFFIVPNIGSTVLYGTHIYNYDEVRNMLEEVWFIIDKFATLKAKDKEFEEIRYMGFNNLSYLYVTSAMAYWYDGKTIDYESLSKDTKIMKRFIALYYYIKKMDKYYKIMNYKLYKQSKNDFVLNKRAHRLLVWILDYLTITKQYESQKEYCNSNKNIMLKEYIETRNNLLDLKKGETQLGQRSIEKALSDFTDENLNKICKNLKFIKGIKNGNDNN